MPNFATLPLNATTTVGIATGSKLTHAPRVLTASFGDGYSQRTVDGINADPIRMSVRFTNLKRGEAVRLDAFLAGLKGATPFLFTIPGEASPRQWICPTWDRSFDNKAIENMSASFEENFDP